MANVINFPAWPGRIVLDGKAAELMPGEVDRIGARRAFILSAGSLLRNGVAGGVAEALGGRLAGLCASIPAHAPQSAIMAAARQARESGADCIVSIGGGSVIDAAKLVHAALADDLMDLEALAAWRVEKRSAPKQVIRHIAAPTTLSAAEFTWFAGAKHPETGLKQAFAARWLVPSAILYDSAIALLTPRQLWLSSGIRAVDHAVETVLSPGGNPFAEALALAGLRALLPALAATAADPEDLAARRESQLAVWLCSAGLMSAVPMGACHAIGHVLGSLFDVPHGIASCVMLPAVMRFNGEHVPERLARLADVLGPDPAEALKARIAGLGLPARLQEIGIGPADHGRILEGLAHEQWLGANPRPISGAADIERILTLAS